MFQRILQRYSKYWYTIGSAILVIITVVVLITGPKPPVIPKQEILSRLDSFGRVDTDMQNETLKSLIVSCKKVEVLCFKTTGDLSKDDDYGISRIKEILKVMDIVYGRSNTPYEYISVEEIYWERVKPSVIERDDIIKKAKGISTVGF